MPMLNARCRNCKKVFPSGFFVEGVVDASFAGNTSQCPYCGSTGDLIVNGTTIDVIGDQITVKRGFLSSVDLMAAVSTLSGFPGSDRSKKAVEQAIVKVLPEAAPIIRGLTRDQLIVIVIALLAMIQNQLNSNSASVQMSQLIQLVKEQTNQIRQHSQPLEPHLKDKTPEQHQEAQDKPDRGAK